MTDLLKTGEEKKENSLEFEVQEVAAPAVRAEDEQKARKNINFFLYGLVGLVFVAIVAAGAVGIYRAYAKGATDVFTLSVARVLRLPILKVDGARILYKDYAEDLAAITKMRDYDKANGGQGASFTDEQMSDQVLWRLANNIWTTEVAKRYNVTIQNSEIETVKTQLASQFKTTAELEKAMNDRYGWTMDDYEIKVIRPFLTQQKLNEAIAADQSLRTEVLNEANRVLNEIRNGADFEQMARQYGQDGTAQNGGDLGWFGKGEMVPQFETAAFGLQKGQLSQNLVETQYGYHILRVDDRKKEKEKDSKGKNVEVEKIKARHILFRNPDIDIYLDGMAKRAVIHLYARINNPFEELKKS